MFGLKQNSFWKGQVISGDLGSTRGENGDGDCESSHTGKAPGCKRSFNPHKRLYVHLFIHSACTYRAPTIGLTKKSEFL